MQTTQVIYQRRTPAKRLPPAREREVEQQAILGHEALVASVTLWLDRADSEVQREIRACLARGPQAGLYDMLLGMWLDGRLPKGAL